LSTNLTPEQMEKYLFDLPEQFRTSLSMDLTHISRYTREYRQVVISGLGGSAIGGDILRSFAMPRVDIPVIVNRDYDVPKFVNENTLFLAISYSGNTEETLSSFHKARDRGASIICITSGGKLESLAARRLSINPVQAKMMDHPLWLSESVFLPLQPERQNHRFDPF
jgi:glucose/mannose-6-phosphate isomerase